MFLQTRVSQAVCSNVCSNTVGALQAAKSALDAALQREENLKKECKLVKGEAAAR